MSVNLRLTFAFERFLFKKLWLGVGAAGKDIPMQTASLCSGCDREWFLGWFLWLGGLTIKRGKGEGDGDERYGQVGERRKDASRGQNGTKKRRK